MDKIASTASKHFGVTLKLLNANMNMCLPERDLDASAFDQLDHWKQLRFFGENASSLEDRHEPASSLVGDNR